jgi:hypothetical protein
MTQNNELANVKRRIRALTEKTVENGATEAEAMLAMTKVGELLEQYNLSMNEVTLRQEVCTTLRYETNSKHTSAGVDTCVMVGSFCGLKVWITRSRMGIVINYFGLESDAQMAMYLTELIEKSYQTSYQAFKLTDTYVTYSGHRRSLNTNFLRGYVSMINMKLGELRKERLDRERESAKYHAERAVKVQASDEAKVEFARQTTGTALISIAKDRFVEEEFAKMGMKLRTTYRQQSGSYNGSARAAGSEAGRNVNLSRPINNRGGGSFGGYLK